MKLLRGTIFGGIAFFFLGWLVWGILLAGIMDNFYDTSLSRPEDQMIWWALILSNLVYAMLITLALKWAGAKNVADALKLGAIIGALYGLSVDLGILSMSTMINNVAGVLIDAIAYALVTAIVGLVIVLTWGKGK